MITRRPSRIAPRAKTNATPAETTESHRMSAPLQGLPTTDWATTEAIVAPPNMPSTAKVKAAMAVASTDSRVPADHQACVVQRCGRVVVEGVVVMHCSHLS